MGQMAKGPVAGNISRKDHAKVVGFGCVAPSAAGRVVALGRSIMPRRRLSLSAGPFPVRSTQVLANYSPDDWPGDELPWTGCDTLPRA